MSFTDKVSKYHDKLFRVMSSHIGETLKTARIKGILITSCPELRGEEQWIYPSDHCINHTNKGACTCIMNENAIFEKIVRGKYKVR